MAFLIRSKGGLLVTRDHTGQAVRVANEFVLFDELPRGIPEYGDGDYEVRYADDGSNAPRPEPYSNPPVPDRIVAARVREHERAGKAAEKKKRTGKRATLADTAGDKPKHDEE